MTVTVFKLLPTYLLTYFLAYLLSVAVDGRGYGSEVVWCEPGMLTRPVNEYQLWLERQRQVWLILIADEMQGVQVKL